MIKAERFDKIIKTVNEKEYISASDLSKQLNVSMPTIRRDLAELHKQKQLTRSHGGAMKYTVLKTINVNAEQEGSEIENIEICQKAAQLICNNDIIFIDASLCTLPLVQYVADRKNLTVITNGLSAAALLKDSGIKAYCTGGEIEHNSSALSGSFAEEFVSGFNIDTAFFSCDGVTSKGMLVDASLSGISLKRRVVKLARKCVFLCNSSVFNVTAPYNLMSLDELDYIVTSYKKVDDFFAYNYKTTVIKV